MIVRPCARARQLLGLVVLMLGLLCGQAQRCPPRPITVPDALVLVIEHGENSYQFARECDWTRAGREYAWYAVGLSALDAAVIGRYAAKNELQATVCSLYDAIVHRDRIDAMTASSRIIAIAVGLCGPYNPAPPVDVMRLECCGRTLEIAAESGDHPACMVAVADITRTWRVARPVVVSRGGRAVAVRFDHCVAQLYAATTPARVKQLIPLYVDTTQKVKGVFL